MNLVNNFVDEQEGIESNSFSHSCNGFAVLTGGMKTKARNIRRGVSIYPQEADVWIFT